MHFRLLIATLLVFGAVSASETREAIGTRPLTEEQITQIKKNIESEPKEEKILAKGAHTPTLAAKCITQVGYNGSSLILCDGSVWEVKSSDRSTVRKWLEYGYYEIPVYVSTNNDWLFSNQYPYEVVNEETGQRVRVFMTHAPYESTQFWVTYIDYSSCYVEITNKHSQTYLFSLTSWDVEVLKFWKRGDRIFLGVNNTWNEFSSPYLLLNVETLSSCRGDIGGW